MVTLLATGHTYDYRLDYCCAYTLLCVCVFFLPLGWMCHMVFIGRTKKDINRCK